MSLEMEMRPPYVTWTEGEVEDRAKTLESGHFVGKRVDYANVTRPGQKDTLVKEANAYIADCFRAAREGRMPAAWPEHFKQSYERWKAGTDAAVDGTPIKGWPVLSAAQQSAIIAAGILSVEDLAQMSDSELPRIGMGAGSYKQKAIAWLGAAKDIGKTAEQVSAQAVKIQELETLVQRLSEQLALTQNTPAKTVAKA
jgi:hypothetical protein